MKVDHTFKEFVERHPDKTMVGMAWALWWRLFATIYGTLAGIGLIYALCVYLS